jgi:hypothetical protein
MLLKFQTACDNYDGCSFYTFVTTEKHCLMFDLCPTIDEACTDCVTGQPGV